MCTCFRLEHHIYLFLRCCSSLLSNLGDDFKFLLRFSATNSTGVQPTNQISFSSNQDIRLVEIYDRDGTVTWFKEYSTHAQKVELELMALMETKKLEVLRGCVWNTNGKSRRFQFTKSLLESIQW